jgi:predicted small secreted protein
MPRSRWFSVIWLSLVLALGLSLAACGDTWEGLKKDTGDNLEAVGSTMQGAGEDVQEDAAQ